MRLGKLGAALPLVLTLLASCGGGKGAAAIGLTLDLHTATVSLKGGSQQFTATVVGSQNTAVNWTVNDVANGNTTLGQICISSSSPCVAPTSSNSNTVFYVAPAALPNSGATVTIKAVAAASSKATDTAMVKLDSGIRVTVLPTPVTLGAGPNEPGFQFTATVTNNTAVNWFVNGIANGNSTFGNISTTGIYTPPAAVPSPAMFMVTAVSAADPTHNGSASVTIVLDADPTLASIEPTNAAQGSVFQDIYLNGQPGTNYFTTSTVVVSGSAVPTTILTPTFLSPTLLRARIRAELLAAEGSLTVKVQRPSNGHLSGSQTLTVGPVRAAVIAASPDSVPQSSGSQSVNITGGYYSPSTSAEFNGQPLIPTLAGTRQLSATLPPGPLGAAGLFSLLVRNGNVAPGSPAVSAVNLAVVPLASAVPSAPCNTISVGVLPVAVAIDTGKATAVVVNQTDRTVSLIDLKPSNCSAYMVTGTVPVGNVPTGVAVDNVRHCAIVVNSGDNTLSVVNLGGCANVGNTVTLPSGTIPFSVGLNPLTGRALVANSSSNLATVVDFATVPPTVLSPQVGGTSNPIGTGLKPAVAIEPRLNWAVITPGGAGPITIVDLGRPAIPGDVGRAPAAIASFARPPSAQGIAINTETDQALIADPNDTVVKLFSLLDQTPGSIAVDSGEVAAAVNPLTDVGVTVSNTLNEATILDLRNMQKLTTNPVPVGTDPEAVAIDPATNVAVVANKGDNKVSILSLGPIRSLHLTQISPATTFTSGSPLTLTVTGHGFTNNSVVRLDETPVTLLPGGTDRELTATIPASDLSSPRRFVVDVTEGGSVSNEMDLMVIQAVTVGTSPQAVAVDSDHHKAVITNSGSNDVSVVDLTTRTEIMPRIIVGTSPQGVAVLPRLQRAVVTNNGSNSVSLVDYSAASTLGAPLTFPFAPLGVAIQPDTARAVVALEGSNQISVLAMDALALQSVGGLPVDDRPLAVAIDPSRNRAAVTTAALPQNSVVFVDLATLTIPGRVTTACTSIPQQLPTGVAFDPVSDAFIVANSLQNNLTIIDAGTLKPSCLNVGIHPTSVDYNFQTSTAVTVNSASHTVSVLDFLGQSVRAVLSLDGSTAFSVAIDQSSNIAVIADQNNNRILLVPLPR